MKIFKDRLLKKIVHCPGCSQNLRVPIRRGKRLRITCSRCHCQFDISFQSPLVGLFKWYSGYGFKYNLKSFLLRLKGLPLRSILLLLIFVLLILRFAIAPVDREAPPSIDHYDEVII